MNNKRSGKPFSGKKGAPGKKSESRDSDKKSNQGKKNYSPKPYGSSFKKNNPENRFKANKKSSEAGSEKKKSFKDKDRDFTKKSFSKSSRTDKKETSPSFRKKQTGRSNSRNESSNYRDKKNSSGKNKSRDGKTYFSEKGRKQEGNSYSKSRFDKTSRSTEKSTAGKTFKQPSYDIKPPRGSKKEEPSDGKIRLNKYIANSGVCSRRDADELISLGEVTVNGKIVTELGFKVTKDDVVTLNGRRLTPEKLVYVLLNKPKDFITTTDDPQERKTVMSLVQNACKERIFPVGRLDRNTTGLLLFTNDGDLAEKLTHPSKKIKKIYQADLDKPITRDDFEKIQNGLRLEDGPVKPDALAIVSADKKSVGIEIHEGRNRIVRRIFEHLGYEVIRLDRVMYAGLTKKDLPRGHWRYLTEKEVIRLKYF